MSTMLKV